MGGRPKASHTLIAEKLRAELVLAVEEESESIYGPQLEKAKRGDFQAYKDLLDRVVGRPTESVRFEGTTKILIMDEQVVPSPNCRTTRRLVPPPL